MIWQFSICLPFPFGDKAGKILTHCILRWQVPFSKDYEAFTEQLQYLIRRIRVLLGKISVFRFIPREHPSGED
jgi:hypothetical protein